MKVFLTGSTGFIGRVLTIKLINSGNDVIALVRNPESENAKKVRSMGAELAVGDITDRESMRSPMTGADAVIHNAGWYEFGISGKARKRMFSINVEGTKNTLSLANESGVKKIIHISSILAYGETGDIIADESFKRVHEPKSVYEETKTKAHEYAESLQKNGAPLIICCPAGVIGPGDHSGIGQLMRLYQRGLLPPVLWGHTGHRANVHVEDLADAITKCLEKGRLGETYLLSNGNMNNRDMFNLWKQTPGGFKNTRLWLPYPIALIVSAMAVPFEKLLRLPNLFNCEFTRASFSNFRFTSQKAVQELDVTFRSLNQAWLDTLNGELEIKKKKIIGLIE